MHEDTEVYCASCCSCDDFDKLYPHSGHDFNLQYYDELAGTSNGGCSYIIVCKMMKKQQLRDLPPSQSWSPRGRRTLSVGQQVGFESACMHAWDFSQQPNSLTNWPVVEIKKSGNSYRTQTQKHSSKNIKKTLAH